MINSAIFNTAKRIVNDSFTWLAQQYYKARVQFFGNVVVGGSALATTATTGFLYIPTCAGTPTGVPVTETGTAAVVFDTTNNKLYVYDGGWVDVT